MKRITKLYSINKDKNTINLPKNPIKGGIPAKDKKIKATKKDATTFTLFNKDNSNELINSYKSDFLYINKNIKIKQTDTIYDIIKNIDEKNPKKLHKLNVKNRYPTFAIAL